MRHPIEKSPRDGTAIILEDDASGTSDIAHRSTEAGQWLGENGEPTKLAETLWYPLALDQYLLREDERSRNQSRRSRARRPAVCVISVTVPAGSSSISALRSPSAATRRQVSSSRRHIIPPFCLAPMERATRRRKHASITRRHMLAARGGKGPTRRIGPVGGAGFNSCIVDAG